MSEITHRHLTCDRCHSEIVTGPSRDDADWPPRWLRLRRETPTAKTSIDLCDRCAVQFAKWLRP